MPHDGIIAGMLYFGVNITEKAIQFIFVALHKSQAFTSWDCLGYILGEAEDFLE